jgi:2-C-methyl-D-erythritol 4-phosphate cytidylyltransferase
MSIEGVAVVLAAGSGERLAAGRPKAFIEVAGRPMLQIACESAAACPQISSLVVVVPDGMEEEARDLVDVGKQVGFVAGGATRQGSARAALGLVGEAEATVVHDAARPFATAQLFSRVLAALARADGAIPVTGVTDTVKRVHDGLVIATEPRDSLGAAQTPQAFRTESLKQAHERAERAGLDFTDDSAVVEWAGYPVAAVPGEDTNMKITTPLDLARAELIASELRSEGPA